MTKARLLWHKNATCQRNHLAKRVPNVKIAFRLGLRRPIDKVESRAARIDKFDLEVPGPQFPIEMHTTGRRCVDVGFGERIVCDGKSQK